MADPQSNSLHDLSVRVSIIEERERGNAERLKQQAIEYLRRLDELNHAHAQRMARDADYVLREKFETYEKEYRLWRDEVAEAIASLQGRSTGGNRIKDQGIAVVALVIAFLAILAPPLIQWITRPK